MLPLPIARDRAFRRAISTGDMRPMEMIHTLQVEEGFRPCFGRSEGYCPHTDCSWHQDCMALVEFDLIAASRRMPLSSPSGGSRLPDRVGLPIAVDSPTERSYRSGDRVIDGAAGGRPAAVALADD